MDRHAWGHHLDIRIHCPRCQPTAQINLERSLIRVGARTLAFDDITRARILDEGLLLNRVELVFGNPAQLELIVTLHDGSRIYAAETTRRLVAEALRLSAVDIPRDRYDPDGKFARSGAPLHITRDEAVALVLDPMPADGPLPIIR